MRFVGEPMESVCEEAGPQELSKVCHSKIVCSTSSNVQKEVAVCPTIEEFQKQVADIAPSSSETVRKDPKPIQDERTAATAPKPGKTCNTIQILKQPVQYKYS